MRRLAPLSTLQATLLLALLLVVACGAPKRVMSGQSDNLNYLPLKVGNRWILRSTAVPTPIVLEVIAENSGSFDLKFDNPWVSSVLTLEPANGQYRLKALSMGEQRAPMHGDVYFDFTAKEGQSWKNEIGTLTLLNRQKTVKTADATYSNCVEFREVNKQGNKLFWFFAPGVGFVQFGEGPGAFVLDQKALPAAPSESAPTPNVTPPISQPSTGVPRTDSSAPGRPLLAVAANPAPNEGFTPKTVNARFDQALAAGATYVYLSPKWNELEPSPNSYKFKDLDFQVGQAMRGGLVLICNLRVLDTNQRAMPTDLRGRAFNDPVVKDRLAALLRAMFPRMNGRLRYMLIGNEVDSYFGAHKDEVNNYLELFQAGKATMQSLDPAIPVSLSTGFGGLSQLNSLLKPLDQAVDFLALTYYPLRPDFTVRDPSDVPEDFERMIHAARERKILLQEVGYPSSPVNNSAEEKQAQMYRAVFQQLKRHRDAFIGANFLFLSNLSESVVNDLAKYYNLPNADRFKAYLRTLGMLDDQGQPKPSWQVFVQEAKSL